MGSVWATMGRIQGDEFPAEIRDRALELGRKLVHSWKEKITVPGFPEKYLAFEDRMRTLMTYRKDEWPYEYDYWKKNRALR